MKWILVILFWVMSLIGCSAQKTDQILTEENLQKISVDSIVKLSDLIRKKSDFICVLYPYQELISEQYRENIVINKYLRDIKYQANESYWALVTLNAESPEILKFKRSKKLDIFSLKQLENTGNKNLPNNFEIVDCAPFDQAAFFKISINNRIYLIFGRAK